MNKPHIIEGNFLINILLHIYFEQGTLPEGLYFIFSNSIKIIPIISDKLLNSFAFTFLISLIFLCNPF